MQNRLEEVEEIEDLVWKIEDPYVHYDSPNFEVKEFILTKTLYYIKLGVTAEELRKKLEKIILERKNK